MQESESLKVCQLLGKKVDCITSFSCDCMGNYLYTIYIYLYPHVMFVPYSFTSQVYYKISRPFFQPMEKVQLGNSHPNPGGGYCELLERSPFKKTGSEEKNMASISSDTKK